MKYNPKEKKIDLMPAGWYLVEVEKGKTGLTRKKGYERWELLYKILGVAEIEDDSEVEDAKKFVGKKMTDTLVDAPNLDWKWDIFLRAVFPENKGKDEELEVRAEHCVGRKFFVKVAVKDGNPEYDEPDKKNVCNRYKTAQVEEKKEEDPLAGAF